LAARAFGAVRGKFSGIRLPVGAETLGYLPIELFATLLVVTLGLYPYIWLWSNANVLVKFCGGRVRAGYLKRFTAIGLCVQLLLPSALISYALWYFVGYQQFHTLAIELSAGYIASYALLVFPQRCYYYFDLRWNMRNAVSSWDSNALMIDRTLMSWFKLFVFGSGYIQLHTNRLIGLGMPGLASQDEILPDFSISKWLREYVLIRRPAAVETAADIPQEKSDG
jgi:hypothetical protein